MSANCHCNSRTHRLLKPKTPSTAMIIQMINVCGFLESFKYVAFDENGKDASLDFHNRLFQALKEHSYIFFDSMYFNRATPYSYIEKFFCLEKGKMVEVDKFSVCTFYERSFYTSDQRGNDMGIVSFSAYCELNSGVVLGTENFTML